MRSDRPQGLGRLAAALIAAAFLAFAAFGLTTGDLSSRRHPGLDRATNPLFFWTYIVVFAAIGGYAALAALGIVEIKAPRPEANAERLRRDTAQRLAFLALLTSGGAAYAWWTERSVVNPGVFNEIMGWIALGALGLAVWPPVLAPGPVRTVLRIAGSAAILLAALAILRLIR